jgi:hypothetical protein
MFHIALDKPDSTLLPSGKLECRSRVSLKNNLSQKILVRLMTVFLVLFLVFVVSVNIFVCLKYFQKGTHLAYRYR